MIRIVGISLSFGLLLVLGAASTLAGESEPGKQNAAAGSVPTGTAAGPMEGLRVHGHWTIEVRNPDGALVDRREFENALTIGGGDLHLSNLLARTLTAGTWMIRAEDVVGSNYICADSGGAATTCFVVESTDPTPAGFNVFKTLTTSVAGSTLVLNGSIIAQLTGQIAIVGTANYYCLNTVAPAACTGGNMAGNVTVTNAILPAPVPVQNGQQVQVRVVISFS